MLPAQAKLVLGIMSGTSMDGVDYALCRIGNDEISLVRHWHIPFPRTLQERVREAARGASASFEVAQLHHDLGRFYAEHARGQRKRLRTSLVALHGQTIFHHPGRRNPATLQLGEAAYLAEKLRTPVICNFRAADMAAGGQGAPLATAFHLRVFARHGRHICVNNLGGISNLTSIDWRQSRRPKVLAFDTGPANVLIDLALRHFTGGRKSMDQEGAWAARGQTCESVLQRWLRHSYFTREPPKSTGRELFGEPFFARALADMHKARLSKFDMLSTLTEFTARSLAMNYRLHLASTPSLVILSGGGAANPALVRRIRSHLESSHRRTCVVTSDQLGWPLQTIEPAAFALLAWLRVKGLSGNLPQTTGARRAVLLGQQVEG